jgi:hypothetical protein
MGGPWQDLIQQVIARSRLPGQRRRREILRELSAHLEDSAEALRGGEYDECSIERMVELRFGDAEAVGRAFAVVYRRDRWVRSAASVLALFVAAILAATMVIGGIQSLVAIGTAHPLRATFADATSELIGIAAVAVGYCSPYLAERLGVPPVRQTLWLVGAIGLAVGGYCIATPPAQTAMPIVAFACAASARLLQRFDVPLLWLGGTAGPLLIAWYGLGPLIETGLPGARLFPWSVWCGITGACLLLRPIVRLFEGHVFDTVSTTGG